MLWYYTVFNIILVGEKVKNILFLIIFIGVAYASDNNSSIRDLPEDLANIIVPKIKEEILSQEDIIKFAKECFEKSDTLKDANRCEKIISKKIGEPSEPFEIWTKQTKKETLIEINKGLKSIECIKKANTMADIDACQSH